MAELFKVSREEIEHCIRMIGRADKSVSADTIETILEQLRPTLSKLNAAPLFWKTSVPASSGEDRRRPLRSSGTMTGHGGF